MKRIGIFVFLLLLPIACCFVPSSAADHPPGLERPVACITVARFSPAGGIADVLIKAIGDAKKTVRLAMYALNNVKVVTALIAAKDRGVDIAGKFDKTQSAMSNQAAQIDRLKKAGIKADISSLSRLLHDKFIVIDTRWIFTGSYNFTDQAETKYRENSLQLECPEIAERYEQEWGLIE
jgi:phosphatidylserine/phosphatidylglycerophosphate/cardiolipin synthase-like enzyme